MYTSLAILFGRAALASLVACFIVVGLAVAGESSSKIEKSVFFSVDRTKKSDQLLGAAQARGLRGPALSSLASARPPFGCDALFSTIGEPLPGRLYRRCVA